VPQGVRVRLPPSAIKDLRQIEVLGTCLTFLIPSNGQFRQCRSYLSERPKTAATLFDPLGSKFAGAIAPTLPEYEHFLKVDREEVEPATVDERAWMRLKGRREFEREQRSDPSPPEDYGIIEWDKEKCWW
jgi:hypothetical protein